MSERSKNIFSIFQIFKIFFWKMASMGHNKCWKEQSHEIWAQSERPPRRHVRYPSRGVRWTPPQCRIGLKSWHIETYHERREELKCAICQKSICQKRRPQKRQFKKNLWLSGRNKKLKKLIMKEKRILIWLVWCYL